MGDRDHWNTSRDRPVEINEVCVERSVVRGDHGQVRECSGVERADERMVVHNVNAFVFESPVCMRDMADLVNAAPDADPDGRLKGEGLVDRAGAVPGRAEKNVVAGAPQSAGERVEDILGPAVGRGGHWEPRGRHDRDAH